MIEDMKLLLDRVTRKRGKKDGFFTPERRKGRILAIKYYIDQLEKGTMNREQVSQELLSNNSYDFELSLVRK
jgi:hypothetical protein